MMTDLKFLSYNRRMDAEFVEDVTFPDGSHIQPSTKFVKRWQLRNIGTHAWTTNTKVSTVEPIMNNLPSGQSSC